MLLVDERSVVAPIQSCSGGNEIRRFILSHPFTTKAIYPISGHATPKGARHLVSIIALSYNNHRMFSQKFAFGQIRQFHVLC